MKPHMHRLERAEGGGVIAWMTRNRITPNLIMLVLLVGGLEDWHVGRLVRWWIGTVPDLPVSQCTSSPPNTLLKRHEHRDSARARFH